MRRIPVSKLVPGVRLARPVLGLQGEMYLGAGVILTRRYIEKLGQMGFETVFIEDLLLEGIEIQDVISEQTRQAVLLQVRQVLIGVSSSNARVLNTPPELTAAAESIVKELLDKSFPVVNLIDVRAEGEYLFHHSVNVCVLAVLAGIKSGLRKDQLLELAVGALLHDLGKVRVEPEILNKPGDLTENEFGRMQRHCEYGRDLLREHPEASAIAYAHHERYNGEGYPMGLKNEDISFSAQLVGIADIYDALTSNRCYRGPIRSHEALELIAGTGNWWFGAQVVHHFLSCVAAYPTGSMVQLSTGEIAVVIDTPSSYTFFPNVRVLLDAEWQRLLPYQVSTVNGNLWVARVLDEEETEAVRRILHGAQ